MEQKKVTGISKYLPAFGVKGWGIALMGMAFYYFYQGPLHFAINFYYGYFEALYGWTNSQLAAAITIGQLVGVAGIFIWGPLNKKLGSKKVAIIGLLGGAISTMFFAFAPSIPTFYLSVILFCFFAVAYSQIAVATFAANWFPRTRGMYMGMATMGLTIGNATVTLVTSKMVPVYGVKITLIMWSTLMVIVAILVALFAKNNPEEAGAWPDNDRSVSMEELMAEAKAAEEYKKHSPWTVSAVLRCKYTWTIAIGWGLCMMCAGGFLGQLVPTLASFGHDPAFGIMLLTSLWPTGIIGNWLGGVADNSFGTRTASIIFVCFEIAACIGLIMAGSNPVVATLCTGTFMAAMSAFSNVTVSMVTNVFGRQDFENAWPVVSVPFKIIESFGVLLISMVAAKSSFSGSYVAMIVLLIVAIVLMLMTTTKQIGSQIHEEKTASAYFE